MGSREIRNCFVRAFQNILGSNSYTVLECDRNKLKKAESQDLTGATTIDRRGALYLQEGSHTKMVCKLSIIQVLCMYVYFSVLNRVKISRLLCRNICKHQLLPILMMTAMFYRTLTSCHLQVPYSHPISEDHQRVSPLKLIFLHYLDR